MKNSAVLVLVMALLFAACEPEISFVKEKIPASLDGFYQKQRGVTQPFSISNTSGGVITTSKGGKIYLPANGFETLSGGAVSGSVDISVKEILTPQDMIFNNIPTTSGGLLLESGGMYNIKVTKDNQPLRLKAGNFLRIVLPNIPGTDMNGMQVFNGRADAKGDVDWVPNNAPGNFVVRDSIMFSNSSLFTDSINWINCDKFINDPTVPYTVYPGNAPSNDSTNVFVHLTGLNSIVKMNWTQGLSYFKSDNLLAVPSTLVGISIKNGQLYASLKAVNVQAGQSVTLNFTAYTESELKAKLAQLQ